MNCQKHTWMYGLVMYHYKKKQKFDVEFSGIHVPFILSNDKDYLGDICVYLNKLSKEKELTKDEARNIAGKYIHKREEIPLEDYDLEGE